MQIMVSKNGQQHGPYGLDELRQLVLQGKFTVDDSACFDGHNWGIISEVPGFAALSTHDEPNAQATSAPNMSQQSPHGMQPGFPYVRYQDITGLTGTLKMLLSLSVLMAAIGLWSSSLQADLLDREFTPAEAEANDSREQLLGLIDLGLYLVTVVFFSCWIVRANKNVRAFGAQGLRITPGWACGWFFVPIANIWKPCQAMKDLWQASHNPHGWTSGDPCATVGVWWAAFLLNGWITNAAARATWSARSVDQLKSATTLWTFTQLLTIVSCFTAIALVSKIADAQNKHAGNSA